VLLPICSNSILFSYICVCVRCDVSVNHVAWVLIAFALFAEPITWVQLCGIFLLCVMCLLYMSGFKKTFDDRHEILRRQIRM